MRRLRLRLLGLSTIESESHGPHRVVVFDPLCGWLLALLAPWHFSLPCLRRLRLLLLDPHLPLDRILAARPSAGWCPRLQPSVSFCLVAGFARGDPTWGRFALFWIVSSVSCALGPRSFGSVCLAESPVFPRTDPFFVEPGAELAGLSTGDDPTLDQRVNPFLHRQTLAHWSQLVAKFA